MPYPRPHAAHRKRHPEESTVMKRILSSVCVVGRRRLAYAFYEPSAEAGSTQAARLAVRDIRAGLTSSDDIGTGVIYVSPFSSRCRHQGGLGASRPGRRHETGARAAGVRLDSDPRRHRRLRLERDLYRASAEWGMETARAPRLHHGRPRHYGRDSARGQAPTASLDGWLRRDAQYGSKRRATSVKDRLLPFRLARWKASDPVRVFLRADPSAPIALSRPAAATPPRAMKLPKGFCPVGYFAPSDGLCRVTIEGRHDPAAARLRRLVFAGPQGVKMAGDYVVLEASPSSKWPPVGVGEIRRNGYLLTYLAVPIGLVIVSC